MRNSLFIAFALFFITTTAAFAQMDADFSIGGAIRVGASTTICDAAATGGIRYESGYIQWCNGTAWAIVGASAAAPDRGIQFNSSGSFAASSNFKYMADGDLLLTGTYTGTASVPATGAGTRMFFDTQKAAFRAGNVSNTQWDNASIGNYSVAMGYNTTASGNQSTAMGYLTTASGIGSMAMGDNSTAAGDYSTAFGREVNISATGDGSAGFGLTTTSPAIDPIISGAQSFGVFMGNHSGKNLSAANTVGFFGGKMVIDPAVPAVDLVADSTLDVNGEVKIGNTGLACSATTEGAMRYNTTSDCIELCNGTAWACVAVAACSDATPAVFDFNDLVNQSVSTLVTSNILQITGLGCTVNIAISGEGTPQYRVCSDATCSSVLVDWKSGTDLLVNNNYLQLRLTTSAAGGDTYSATVVVGTSAEVWNATPTGDCTGSPAAGTVCADGSVYAGLSPDGNVKMYTTRCDAGQTWNGTACTGTRGTPSWNNGTSNWTTTGYVSAIAGKSNSAGISALSDAGSIHYAARYCETLGNASEPEALGFTDWYLPAKNELNVMYGNNGVIGNFLTNGSFYWSSSEYYNFSAWYQRFSDGFQNDFNKSNAFYVRCVRR